MSGYRALPIVVAEDDDGTPAIIALCGAEAATMRRGTAHGLTRLRAAPPALNLNADVTASGVISMILHVKTCGACQELNRRHLHPLDTTPLPAGASPLALAGPEPSAGATGRGVPADGLQPASSEPGRSR